MNNNDWSKAPEWATMYGAIGFLELKCYANNDKYRYINDLDCYEFCDSSTYNREEFTMIEKRPEQEPNIKTYTGQMTADQLKNTKIRIESVEHGKAFREMVDSAFNNGKNILIAKANNSLNTNNVMPFWFCSRNGEVAQLNGGFMYFKNHEYTEIKWQPDEATKKWYPEVGDQVVCDGQKCEVLSINIVDNITAITVTTPKDPVNIAETYDLVYLLNNDIIYKYKPEKEQMDEWVNKLLPKMKGHYEQKKVLREAWKALKSGEIEAP